MDVYTAYQVVTILAVAVAMVLALAHALELPGKLRLPREHYLAVQQIYYPGFTIAAVAQSRSACCSCLGCCS